MREMTYEQRKKAAIAAAAAILAVLAVAAVLAAAQPRDGGADEATASAEEESPAPSEAPSAGGQEGEQGKSGAVSATAQAPELTQEQREALSSSMDECLTANAFPAGTRATIKAFGLSSSGETLVYSRVDPDYCFVSRLGRDGWVTSPLRERVAGVNDDLSDDRISSSSTRRVTEADVLAAAPAKSCAVDDAGALAGYIGEAAAANFASDWAAYLAAADPAADPSSFVVALDSANQLGDGSVAVSLWSEAAGRAFCAQAEKGAEHAGFSRNGS